MFIDKLCAHAILNCLKVTISMKIDLELYKLQRLICHKTQPAKPNNQTNLFNNSCLYIYIYILYIYILIYIYI